LAYRGLYYDGYVYFIEMQCNEQHAKLHLKQEHEIGANAGRASNSRDQPLIRFISKNR